jgi:quinol monooxygenase YgiN
MPLERREFLAMTGAALMAPLAGAWSEPTAGGQGGAMYGLIGKITAVAGQRDALAGILLEGTAAMPGCLSYVVATDPADADALWVTEVWDRRESHAASLALPAVQAAIAKGRPLIAGFSNRVETVPIGGHGLPGAGEGGASR